MPSTARTAFEWYATPASFIQWLGDTLLLPANAVCFEPCVGDGVITRELDRGEGQLSWLTNDLDAGWEADLHGDIADPLFWQWIRTNYDPFFLIASNPPYSLIQTFVEEALACGPQIVAVHARLSYLEPLKRGIRRTYLREMPPTHLLVLPRFPYAPSPQTGELSQDSVTSAWFVWDRRTDPAVARFPLAFAPEWVIAQSMIEAADRRRSHEESRAALHQAE